MKIRIFIIFLMLIISLVNSHNLVSQDKKIKPAETEVTLIQDPNWNAEASDMKTNSYVEALQTQMLEAKRSGDIQKIDVLRKQLDDASGTVSNFGEKFDQQLLPREKSNSEFDNINAGLVSSVTGVKGIATCTEQIGQTATRIWSAFAYGPNSGAVNDLLRVCYSDDGGKSWTEKVTLGFSTGNRMWQDQIDMEILEPNTGDKYLWIAFGYATNNYAGVYRVGIDVIKITGALNFAGYTLAFPGTVSSNFYYRPRIVSDNEAYRSNPWIYIACCFDSAVAGGYMSGQKVAIVYSPYTVVPTFTYKPTSFFGLGFIYPSDFHCDIAYYRNGGSDSILLVESSRGDTTKVAIAKSSIGSYVSSSTYLGAFNVTPAKRYQAYIASGGAYNSLMIVNMRKYSPTDWDIEYFMSTTGSLGSWSTGYVDYTGYNSTRADIVGFRSAPGFYACAYSENTMSFVPVTYCAASNNIWGFPVYQMNHINTNPFTAQPRPGIKYGPDGESCFSMWTEYSGSTNVWASLGCSGNVNSWKHIFFRGVMQGLWNAPADTMVNDTARLILRNDFSPYSIVDSAKTFLSNDGYGDFWFTNALNNVNYYIVAKHRNALETWSASTIQFNPVFVSYDFTFNPSQAYGANMIQVDNDPLYAFYSGDADQDGNIDATDLVLIYNDLTTLTSGYVNTDLNGDDFVDTSDLLIAYNNAINVISIITP